MRSSKVEMISNHLKWDSVLLHPTGIMASKHFITQCLATPAISKEQNGAGCCVNQTA